MFCDTVSSQLRHLPKQTLNMTECIYFYRSQVSACFWKAISTPASNESMLTKGTTLSLNVNGPVIYFKILPQPFHCQRKKREISFSFVWTQFWNVRFPILQQCLYKYSTFLNCKIQLITFLFYYVEFLRTKYICTHKNLHIFFLEFCPVQRPCNRILLSLGESLRRNWSTVKASKLILMY
jgi:hypothetical protein